MKIIHNDALTQPLDAASLTLLRSTTRRRVMHHIARGRRQAAHEFLLHGVEQQARAAGLDVKLPRTWT